MFAAWACSRFLTFFSWLQLRTYANYKSWSRALPVMNLWCKLADRELHGSAKPGRSVSAASLAYRQRKHLILL